MTTRLDVEFEVEGNERLRAWLYVPDTPTGPRPAVSMAHGYAGTREHGLDRFARAFAEAGFVVLLHDHRNFGASDGAVRHDVDPWRQIADWRRAISFLEARPKVDASRIGVWGTSYAGGHVLVLGATDRRIRAVVSQVPTISGYEQGLRRIPPEGIPVLEDALSEDERAQARGEPLRRQAIVSADPTVPASYRAKDAIDFYLQPVPAGVWENNVTIRSTRAARMYEPGVWVSRVSPTPL
jgi:dienelactone hydrolase